MTPELAGPLLTRLCLTFPLIYIGVSMAADPRGFMSILERLACVVRTSESRFRGNYRQQPLPEPDAADVSAGMQKALRFTGAALAVCALMALAEMAL